MALQHPQHTWQSWRDRYVRGRAAGIPSDLPGFSPQKDKNSERQRLDDRTGQSDNSHDAPLEVPQSAYSNRQVLEGPQKRTSPESQDRLPNESVVLRAAITPPAQYPNLNGHKSWVRPRFIQNGRSLYSRSGNETTVEETEGGSSGTSAFDADESRKRPFTKYEFNFLLSMSKSIMAVAPRRWLEAWDAYAEKVREISLLAD